MAGDIAFIIQQIKEEKDYFKKSQLLYMLQKERNLPIKYISELLQMKASYICHIIRLNKLPDLVIDAYYSNLLSISHLFVIARLKTESQMIDIYEKALSDNLSVYQTEGLVREALHNVTDDGGEHLSKDEISKFVSAVKNQSSSVAAQIVQTRIKGKVILEIKGNVKHTSMILRALMKKITAADA